MEPWDLSALDLPPSHELDRPCPQRNVQDLVEADDNVDVSRSNTLERTMWVTRQLAEQYWPPRAICIRVWGGPSSMLFPITKNFILWRGLWLVPQCHIFQRILLPRILSCLTVVSQCRKVELDPALLGDGIGLCRACLAPLVEDHPALLKDQLPCQMAKVLHLGSPILPHRALALAATPMAIQPSERLALPKETVAQGLFLHLLIVPLRFHMGVTGIVVAAFCA